jgi:hypothetical protein
MSCNGLYENGLENVAVTAIIDILFMRIINQKIQRDVYV